MKNLPIPMSPPQVTPQILLREGDSELILFSGYFESLELAQLSERVTWQQNKIRVFGRVFDEPRLTAWYGPSYSYSSVKWPQQDMPAFLSSITDLLKTLCDVEFNSVLLNYYRNGEDSMGWHSDNEPEMDTRCIASVSLGASRVFALRRGKSGKSQRTTLSHGDLLCMRNLQDGWQHSIPKKSGTTGPRLNMTFRRIISVKA